MHLHCRKSFFQSRLRLNMSILNQSGHFEASHICQSKYSKVHDIYFNLKETKDLVSLKGQWSTGQNIKNNFFISSDVLVPEQLTSPYIPHSVEDSSPPERLSSLFHLSHLFCLHPGFQDWFQAAQTKTFPPPDSLRSRPLSPTRGRPASLRFHSQIPFVSF